MVSHRYLLYVLAGGYDDAAFAGVAAVFSQSAADSYIPYHLMQTPSTTRERG